MVGYLCTACGTVGDLFPGDGRALAEALGLPLLGRIAFDPRIARCADRGSPYVVEHPDTPAGQAFREMAARFSALL
jgi:ATP-binding protein involved in chromosome partitioning